MSFLTPLFLIGGLAIAAPIIYHLIRQTTREKTVFSSLMFLLPSPPRISTKHRLEHILLLILRCLALLLLAFGFARPFLTQTELNDPTAAQPKRMVILLDRSASMRRDGVWAAARSRAEAVLRRAGPADQVTIFTFDRQAVPVLSFDEWNRTAVGDRVAMAIARLNGITPGWGSTQLGTALITAAESLGENDGKVKPGPRQIFLVSDLQAGSRMDTLQAYEWPKGVELYIEAVKANNPSNAGIQLVAESADVSRAADAPVRVRVTNAADSKKEQFKVGWVRDGTPGFVAPPIDAYVSPGQAKVFAVPLPPAGVTANQIALQGDDEPFDNLLSVIPPAQQKANVLWLGADAPADYRQPLFFLNRAFTETPRVVVTINAKGPAAGLNAAEIQAAHLIFVTEPLPRNSATSIREQIMNGKVAVVVMRTPEIAGTIDALLGKEGTRISEAKVPSAGYSLFSDIDFQHPLFAPFADPRYSDFTKIHLWKNRKLDTSTIPEARVVARLDSNDPFLVEVPVGKGKIFIFTTSWAPDDSQIAVSASKFIPLMWSLLELGGGVVTAPTQFFVGEKATQPPGLGATGVRGPGNLTATLTPPQTEFAQTEQPGIYEFTGGVRAARFAVNLDPTESRTNPLDTDELEHLGVPVAHPAAVAAKPSESKTMLQGMEAENRQKLWRWFIAATLVVLLVESALAGWTARRPATKAAEVAT